MAETHDVAVTGLGIISPCGQEFAPFWRNVRAGESGIRSITHFDTTGYQTKFGGEVRDFEPLKRLKKPAPTRRDRALLMGLVASQQALRQARLIDDRDELLEPLPIATVAGSGTGPSHEVEYAQECYYSKGRRAVRPTTVPKVMFSSLSCQLSMYFGLKGPNQVVTAACASAAIAFGQACLLVRHGYEEIVLVGGADSPLCATMFLCWDNMQVLAQHDTPHKACRPFDRDRNGLVLSEGSAMFILESKESAERRGAPVLAWLRGYGATSDAHHITAPSVEGQALAMRRALRDAGLTPDQIGYINAHGTSTRSNDLAEASAIRDVFGVRGGGLPISASKSVLGHSLGSAGAFEMAVCVAALQEQFVPPTINCDNPDPEFGLDYVPWRGREHGFQFALSNSFAFGGCNSVIVLEKGRS